MLCGHRLAFGDDAFTLFHHAGRRHQLRDARIELQLRAVDVVHYARHQHAVAQQHIAHVHGCDKLACRVLRADVAVQQHQGVALEVGHVVGHLQVAHGIDAVHRVAHLAGIHAGACSGEGVQLLHRLAVGVGVVVVVERQPGHGRGQLLLHLVGGFLHGEIEGGHQVVVAPDAPLGIVVVLPLSIAGEHQGYQCRRHKHQCHLRQQRQVLHSGKDNILQLHRQ